MGIDKVTLNHGGVAKLLKGPEAQAELARIAAEVAPKRADISITEPFVGRARARVEIRSHSPAGTQALRDAIE